MPVPNSPVRHDRFAVYNANLAKNPNSLTDYPKMLTSPADQTTTVVQDAAEHEKLVGATKFKAEPLWGPPSGTKAKLQTESTQVDGAMPSQEPNEVAIPDAARLRRGLKARAMGGSEATIAELVPPQTVFESAMPDPTAAVKNPSLGARPEFKGA